MHGEINVLSMYLVALLVVQTRRTLVRENSKAVSIIALMQMQVIKQNYGETKQCKR